MITQNSYEELLQTAAWKRKRAEILQRDRHQCRNCASRQGLQVHHRQYHVDRTTGMQKAPWEYANKYLVTLCERCHEQGHKTYRIPTFKY